MEKNSKIRASVVGPRGYTGAELIRILANHPHIDEIELFSLQDEGEILSSIPSFRKYMKNLKIKKFSAESIAESDVVFLCLEQNTAHRIVAEIIEKGFKPFIVDLSPDFRFKDTSKYREVYKFDHAALGVLEKTAYGLTELYRNEIKNSDIVANPGCYPTGFILGVSPLLSIEKYRSSVQEFIVDSKSGVTGAGRKALAHLTLGYLSENIKVYAFTEHRHVPEMHEKIKEKFGIEKPILFNAQLIPAKRGILQTIWIRFSSQPDQSEIFSAYEKFSSENYFFDFLSEELPDIYSVQGTNFVRVGIRFHKNHAMIVSVIDNLVKGASGQAVQNMNVKFGFDETDGLKNLPPSNV
ncbi:MAG: N-acetyl-gamma-glutamyl-phosphate reductase [Candidatus Calescibacterium sp.]|nr:N-acetyl-gamma-glutamyl-phosphate reductase [Candidatus Calescibacterium sp.]MCX7734606.1 N-acetyl-gamma-glutamyl-phosphate reductase [bacterium]MDW8086603.1 N-acetyl-gamma-glutamyl-phosphate reductase [Candidatus Calescibacterium sp.]